MNRQMEIIGTMIRNNIMHRRIMDRNLDTLEIHHGQHRILMELAKAKSDSQKDIAEKMNISTATIAVAVKKLEKGGFIEKIMDPSDNRTNNIIITKKGRDIVEKSHRIFESVDKKVLKDFTEEEQEAFMSFLQRINKNLNDIEREEGKNEL